MSTDNSPILFYFSKNLETPRANDLWKFNNSLCSNIDYTTKMKSHLKLIQEKILKENISDEQMIWEYIKYEIRKFYIKFSTQYAKDKRTKTFILEKKLKQLEKNANFNFHNHYLECKNNLEQIYQEKANRIKIRTKCDWYEFGEKSSKFFLNLEKQHPLQNQVQTLLCVAKMELRIKTKLIINCIIFIKHFFTGKLQIKNENITAYLNQISIPVFTGEQSQTCEDPILETNF